jgi:hypothetical protein
MNFGFAELPEARAIRVVRKRGKRYFSTRGGPRRDFLVARTREAATKGTRQIWHLALPAITEAC